MGQQPCNNLLHEVALRRVCDECVEHNCVGALITPESEVIVVGIAACKRNRSGGVDRPVGDRSLDTLFRGRCIERAPHPCKRIEVELVASLCVQGRCLERISLARERLYPDRIRTYGVAICFAVLRRNELLDVGDILQCSLDGIFIHRVPCLTSEHQRVGRLDRVVRLASVVAPPVRPATIVVLQSDERLHVGLDGRVQACFAWQVSRFKVSQDLAKCAYRHNSRRVRIA